MSFETLFFAFRSFLWSKTSIVKSLSNTLASFSGSVYCCLEQLFCRDIVSACLWRKELRHGRYLIVFKTRKAESCILYLCVFLVRNHIRDLQEIWLSVSFWQSCKFYTISLQILLKGDFSKFLEELLFGTYHARVRFLDRVAKHRSFRYFTKKWLNHRRSYSNFENSRSIQRKHLRWSQFSL